MSRRIKRINSLLKEVISEVIKKNVRNPKISPLISVTNVETSKDLRHATVYTSVIGSEEERRDSIKALQSAAGYISVLASKKVTTRNFPSLIFKLDQSVEKQMQIESVIRKIKND